MSDVRERILIVDDVTYNSVITNKYGENNQSAVFFTNNQDNHGDILVGDKLYTNLYDVDPNTDIINTNNYAIDITRNATTHDLELSYINCDEEYFTFDVGMNNEMTRNCVFDVANSNNGICVELTANRYDTNNRELFTCSAVPNGQNSEILIMKNQSFDNLDFLIYPFVLPIRVYFDKEKNGVTRRYENIIKMNVVNSQIAPHVLSIIPHNKVDMFVGDVYQLQYHVTPSSLPEDYSVVFYTDAVTSAFTLSQSGQIVANDVTDGGVLIKCKMMKNGDDYTPVEESQILLSIYPREYNNVHTSINPETFNMNDNQTSLRFDALIYPTEIMTRTGNNYDVTWTSDLPHTGTISNKNLTYTVSGLNYSQMFSGVQNYNVSFSFTDIYGIEHVEQSHIYKGNHVPVTSTISLTSVETIEQITGNDYQIYSDVDETFAITVRLTKTDTTSSYPDPEVNTNLYDIANTFNVYKKTVTNGTASNGKKYVDIRYDVKIKNTAINTYSLNFAPMYPADNNSVTVNLHVDHQSIEATTVTDVFVDPEIMYLESDEVNAQLYVNMMPLNSNTFNNLVLTQNPSGYFTVLNHEDTDAQRVYNLRRNKQMTTPASVTFTCSILNSSTKTATIDVVNQTVNANGVRFTIDETQYRPNMNLVEYVNYDLSYELMPTNCDHDDVIYSNKTNVTTSDYDTKIKFKSTQNCSLSYALQSNNQVNGTMTFTNVGELKPVFGPTNYYINTDTQLCLNYALTTDKTDQLVITFGSSRQDLFTVANPLSNNFIGNNTAIRNYVNSTGNTTLSGITYMRIKTNDNDFNKVFYSDVNIRTAQIRADGITAEWIDGDDLLTKNKTNKLQIHLTSGTSQQVNTFDVQFDWNTSGNITNTLTITQSGDIDDNGYVTFDVFTKTDFASVQNITLTCSDNGHSCTVNAKLCPEINNVNLTINKETLYVLYDTSTPTAMNTLTVTGTSSKPYGKVEFLKTPDDNTMLNDAQYFTFVENNLRLDVTCVKDFKNVSNYNQVINKTVNIRARFNNYYETNTVSFVIRAKINELQSVSTGTPYLKLNETLDISKVVKPVPTYGDMNDVTVTGATMNDCHGCVFDVSSRKFIKQQNNGNTTIGNSTSQVTFGVTGTQITFNKTIALNVIPKRITMNDVNVFVNAHTPVNYSYTCVDYNNNTVNDAIFSAKTFKIESTNTSNVEMSSSANPSGWPQLPELSYTLYTHNANETQCNITLTYTDNGQKTLTSSFNVKPKSITLNDTQQYYYAAADEMTIPLSLNKVNINNNDYLSTTHGEQYDVTFGAHTFNSVSTDDSKFSSPRLVLNESQNDVIHDELTGEDTFTVTTKYGSDTIATGDVNMIENQITTTYSIYYMGTNYFVIDSNNTDNDTSKHLLCKFSYIDDDVIKHFDGEIRTRFFINQWDEDTPYCDEPIITQNTLKANNVFTYMCDVSDITQLDDDVKTSSMIGLYYTKSVTPMMQFNSNVDCTYMTHLTFAFTPTTNTNVDSNGLYTVPNTSDRINDKFAQLSKPVVQLHRFVYPTVQYAQQTSVQGGDTTLVGGGGGGSTTGNGGGGTTTPTDPPTPVVNDADYGNLELILPKLSQDDYVQDHDKLLIIRYRSTNADKSVIINLSELYDRFNDLGVMSTNDWKKYIFLNTINVSNNKLPINFNRCEDLGNAYRIMFNIINENLLVELADSIKIYEAYYGGGNDWHEYTWYFNMNLCTLSDKVLLMCDQLYKINDYE